MGKKIDDDLKNKIINDYKNGLKKPELCVKYKNQISKASLYRIITNIDEPVVNINSEKIIEQKNENKVESIKEENSEDNTSSSEPIKNNNSIDDIEKEVIDLFNDEEIKVEEKNNNIPDSIDEEKSNDNNIRKIVGEYINARNESDNKQQQNIDIYDVKDDIIYYKPPQRSLEELKNDDWQQRKKLIIYIRQYIQNFRDKLKCIIGNNYVQQKEFEKSLPQFNTNDLTVILENIRFELNIERNSKTLLSSVESVLRTIENVASIMKIDITGSANELLQNEDFMHDLKMASCEINISEYITPQRSLFMRGLTVYYKNYYSNKLKNKINDIKVSDDIQSKFNKMNNVETPNVTPIPKILPSINSVWLQ